MSWGKKTTVEECRSVSISFLRKHNYLLGYCSGGIVWKNYYGEETSSISVTVSTMNRNSYVRFQYTNTHWQSGEKTDYDYTASLATTRCHFGGVRYWFICPLVKNGVPCGRRVGTLFLTPGGNYFGCRHCYDLSYNSRNESHDNYLGVLGKALEIDRRIEKVEEKTKRWTYGGKLTRKARRIEVLQQKGIGYYKVAQAMGLSSNGR